MIHIVINNLLLILLSCCDSPTSFSSLYPLSSFSLPSLFLLLFSSLPLSHLSPFLLNYLNSAQCTPAPVLPKSLQILQHNLICIAVPLSWSIALPLYPHFHTHCFRNICPKREIESNIGLPAFLCPVFLLSPQSTWVWKKAVFLLLPLSLCLRYQCPGTPTRKSVLHFLSIPHFPQALVGSWSLNVREIRVGFLILRIVDIWG